MLVTGPHSLRGHFRWLVAIVVLTLAACGWYITEARNTDTLPGGSSRIGLTLGIVAAVIIAFEMLLWPRKRFAKFRTLPLGRTKYWMMAHIWLGLLCVPLTVLHTGFRFGGNLTTALMVLFIVVILSGIWGLILQQLIPRWLLDGVPDEVPAQEIDRVLRLHTEEFARNLAADRGEFGTLPVPGIELIADVFDSQAKAYLLGESRPITLRVARRAEAVFDGLRDLAPAATERIRDLEELCALRRQFDMQTRLNWWLHNWVWIHLPISVALVAFLITHIYTALRYI